MIDFIFLALMLLAMVWVVVASFRRPQRPPYLAADFQQVSQRIRAGLLGLVWILDRSEANIRENFVLPEGLTLPDWALVEGAAANREIRRGCRVLQRDLLDATAFILEQANRFDCAKPSGTKIEDSVTEIRERAASLLLYLHWAGLQLTFSRDRSMRSTLEAGRRHLHLGQGFLEMLYELREVSALEANQSGVTGPSKSHRSLCRTT